MNKYRSEWLKKDYEFEDESKLLSKIAHDLWEDDSINFTYEYKVDVISLSHTVVQCILTDRLGRKVIGVGESTMTMLKKDEEKKSPARVAYKNAFEDAMKTYLLWKVVKDEPEVREELSILIQETEKKSQAEASDEEIKITETIPVEEKPSPAKTPPVEDELASAMISLGRFKKAPITIKELFNDKKHHAWILYVLGFNNSANLSFTGEDKIQVDKMREYHNAVQIPKVA